MMRKLSGWALLAAIALVSSGCYTVLRAPGALSSAGDAEPDYVVAERTEAATQRYQPADEADAWLYEDYGHGYPVTGSSSAYGLYGFGSPFAYGPGLGYSYSYGRYAPVYGPYGYGYDPYYSRAGGSYVPPGYELVTQRELDQLRAERDAANDAGGGFVPAVSRQELERRREREAQRVWTQRTSTERPSSSGYRTPKSSSSSSSTSRVTSSPSSSSKKSSSTKSSGSSAASKRSKRGR